MHDYYQILNIPQTATLPEIKLAYHSLLLKHHPDKNILSKNHNANANLNSEDAVSIDISLLKEAYTTLSSPLSRSTYDTSLKKSHQNTKLGPRPAQLVSLEDFTQLPQSLDAEEKNLNSVLDEEVEERWEYPCRCGGTYRISESDMDKGQHLVGCRSCSEVIWVGYELVHGSNDDEDGDPNGS